MDHFIACVLCVDHGVGSDEGGVVGDGTYGNISLVVEDEGAMEITSGGQFIWVAQCIWVNSRCIGVDDFVACLLRVAHIVGGDEGGIESINVLGRNEVEVEGEGWTIEVAQCIWIDDWHG